MQLGEILTRPRQQELRFRPHTTVVVQKFSLVRWRCSSRRSFSTALRLSLILLPSSARTLPPKAREIREYFIPGFSNWKDHDSYQQLIQRLLGDLKSEKASPPESR